MSSWPRSSIRNSTDFGSQSRPAAAVVRSSCPLLSCASCAGIESASFPRRARIDPGPASRISFSPARTGVPGLPTRSVPSLPGNCDETVPFPSALATSVTRMLATCFAKASIRRSRPSAWGTHRWGSRSISTATCSRGCMQRQRRRSIGRWVGVGPSGRIGQIRESGPAKSPQDVLTEILREGAHQLLAEALEIEIQEFLGQYRDLRDAGGRPRVVRNGYHQQRQACIRAQSAHPQRGHFRPATSAKAGI